MEHTAVVVLLEHQSGQVITQSVNQPQGVGYIQQGLALGDRRFNGLYCFIVHWNLSEAYSMRNSQTKAGRYTIIPSLKSVSSGV
jgi:hypothetical protein